MDSTLRILDNLASLLNRQSRFGEAKAMHRETLELRKEVLGPEHPDTLTASTEVLRSVFNG